MTISVDARSARQSDRQAQLRPQVPGHERSALRVLTRPVFQGGVGGLPLGDPASAWTDRRQRSIPGCAGQEPVLVFSPQFQSLGRNPVAIDLCTDQHTLIPQPGHSTYVK